MKSDSRKRLLRVARLVGAATRLERLAKNDEERTRKMFEYVAGLFMPIESLLEKPGADEDSVLRGINKAGGIRPWLRDWLKRGKSMGAPPHEMLMGVYETLRETIARNR